LRKQVPAETERSGTTPCESLPEIPGQYPDRSFRTLQGAEALADFGLLESAVLRPQTTIGGVDAYASIHEKAAALMHSLIRNHPFVDGNKRTAVVAAFTFYLLNGWEIRTQDSDVVALAVDVAEGQLDVAAIAKRLAGWVTQLRLPDE
jgi:death on curing protein